jgi:hypothetical protein
MRESYRHATCYSSVRALRRVARRTDLFNPDAVKAFLATVSWSESSKERVVNDLVKFYGWKGIPFQKPRYRRVQTLPFIPLETGSITSFGLRQQDGMLSTTDSARPVQYLHLLIAPTKVVVNRISANLWRGSTIRRLLFLTGQVIGSSKGKRRSNIRLCFV